MSVKIRVVLKKIGHTIGKGIDFIMGKPYWALHKLKYRVTSGRVKRATADKAVKITTKAIVRYLVKYSNDDMLLVIADYVRTEYGLTSFSYGGNIGIFKNNYERGVYNKYIVNDKLLQFDVVEELKKLNGIKVEDVKEWKLSTYDCRGFEGAFQISLDIY